MVLGEKRKLVGGTLLAHILDHYMYPTGLDLPMPFMQAVNLRPQHSSPGLVWNQTG